MQSCRRLTHLGLVHNALRILPPLHAVAGTLTKLEISHQLLAHMRGLGEMPALRELILNNNAIARIEGLQGCHRLERLWLFSNRISHIENLAPLGDLRELWLQDNGIETLIGGGLEALVSLTQLSLAGNPIEHLRELQALTLLPSLADLSFADRFFWAAPVADLEGYRQLVITHLKRVVALDGFDISLEERGEVEDHHLRAVLDFNQSIEDLRYRHRMHADELEALRDKNLAAARGTRSRLGVKLQQLEQLAGGKGAFEPTIHHPACFQCLICLSMSTQISSSHTVMLCSPLPQRRVPSHRPHRSNSLPIRPCPPMLRV